MVTCSLLPAQSPAILTLTAISTHLSSQLLITTNQPLYILPPHRHSLSDCSLSFMRASPILLCKLISCCQACLPLTNSSRLIPSKLSAFCPRLWEFPLLWILCCLWLLSINYHQLHCGVSFSFGLSVFRRIGDFRWVACCCVDALCIFTCWLPPSQAHCLPASTW